MFVGLQNSDPEWYSALTGVLNSDQAKVLQDVYAQAEQRKAALGGFQLDFFYLDDLTEERYSLVGSQLLAVVTSCSETKLAFYEMKSLK